MSVEIIVNYLPLLACPVGMGLMILAMALVRNIDFWKKPVWLYMIGSIGLLAATLAMGRSIGGPKNWIRLAGFPFPPRSFVKVPLAFVLVGQALLRPPRGFRLEWPGTLRESPLPFRSRLSLLP